MFKFFDGLAKMFWTIFDFVSSIRLAKNIKSDPEKQPASVRFGVHAILCGISMLVASVFVGLLIMMQLFSIQTLNLVLGIAIAIGAAFLLAHTIKNWLLQSYINKNAMTWISLAVVVACIFGSAGILVGFNFI